MKKLLFVVAMALVATTTLFAQSKLSNYTALMLDARKAQTAEQFKLSPMGMSMRSINGKEMVDCFVHFVGTIDESVLAQYGAELHCRYDLLNIATAGVPIDAIEALAADQRIKLVEAGTPVRQHLDLARSSASRANDVINGTAPLTRGYMGKGVIVGVVDGDLQYDHPAFWSSDHNRFRIKRVWLQSGQGQTPEGFNYGQELDDSATILQKKYDTRSMESGHATHVAGIAAGADHTLNYYGIAQEADIVYVSDDASNEVGLADGIKYCFDYAESVGKPCVVNVSMGSNLGPHDNTSTESRIINSLVGPGRIAVGSAGNSGDVNEHCGKVTSPTDTTFTGLIRFVDQSYGKNLAYIDVYGDIDQNFSVEIVLFDRATKSYVYQSKTIYTTSDKMVSATPDTTFGDAGTLKFNAKMFNNSDTTYHRGHISVYFYTVDDVPSNYFVGLRVNSSDSGMVNIWSMDQYSIFQSLSIGGITNGDKIYTVSEPMGVSSGVITVGSYTTRGSSAIVGKISSFSAKGPTADHRVKPDIAAPGERIMSAYPDLDCIKSDRAESTVVDGKTYWYALMQGTSMSSPYCAGTVATWLEADPTLDPDGIRDVFRHTAALDENTGDASDKPNNTWGYGKLNAYQGLLYVLGLTTKVQDVTETGVLAAYPNPTSDILNIGFPAEDNNVRVAIYDLTGKCVYSNTMSNVSAGENLEVNVSSLAAGAYVVRVAGDKLADTFKLMKE